jgi:hypothetical protein
MIKHRSEAPSSLEGGALAGLIGGIVMSIYMVIGTMLHHGDVWMTMKGAGTPFLHERAQAPGFDALAVGVGAGSSLLISVLWGLGFGAVFYGLSKAATVGAGVVWGVVCWLVMFYVVVPAVGMDVASKVPMGMAILQHVLFGVAVALAFLPFQHPHRVFNVPLTH